MSRFLIANGPMPTTAKFVAVTTGTGLKTMLQLKPFNLVYVTAWGISFDGFTPASPIYVDLVETGTVFATVTTHADVDIFKIGGVADQAAASVAGLTLGTAATGYSASAEGTITATRFLEAPQFITNTVSPFVMQYPLGEEPFVQIANCGRIRVHAPAAQNCYCWMRLRI